MQTPAGPTLLGVDIMVVGSILAAVAAVAVLFAIYTAVTISDPMAKRVKALNARREELKAGVVTATAKKRQSLTRKSDTTEKVKEQLGRMKVLQDSQVREMRQNVVAQFRPGERERNVGEDEPGLVAAVVAAALTLNAVERQHGVDERGNGVRELNLAA